MPKTSHTNSARRIVASALDRLLVTACVGVAALVAWQTFSPALLQMFGRLVSFITFCVNGVV